MVASDLAIRKPRLRKRCQSVRLPTVVVTGVLDLPGHEGQGRIAPAQARQAAARAEHVHLDGLGGQAQNPRDLLGLEMRGDQPEDFPLPGGKLLESGTGTLDHPAKMIAEFLPV
jgi:hypothetical protein